MCAGMCMGDGAGVGKGTGAEDGAAAAAEDPLDKSSMTHTGSDYGDDDYF